MAKRTKPGASALAEAAVSLARAANQETQEVELTDLDDPSDEEADALAALAALGGESGVRFVIKRVKPYDKAGRLDTVGPAEMAELPQRITDLYGPGTYSIFAIDSAGRYVKGKHVSLTIAPDARRSDAGSTPPAAAASAAVSAPSSHADLIREMEARNERMRLEQREDRKWLGGLFVQALPSLVTIFQGRGGSAPSLRDQVETMQGLRELSGGDPSEKLLEVLKVGIEMGREGSGAPAAGGAAGSGWAGAVSEGLQTLRSMIAEGRPSAQAAALPASKEPAAAAQKALPPASVDTNANREEAAAVNLTGPLALAEPLLKKLATEAQEYAETETDPELAANALVAKVPLRYRAMVEPPQLIEWLETPDWWQHVVSFHPPLQGKHGYCDQVRRVLLTMFKAAIEAGGQES